MISFKDILNFGKSEGSPTSTKTYALISRHEPKEIHTINEAEARQNNGQKINCQKFGLYDLVYKPLTTQPANANDPDKSTSDEVVINIGQHTGKTFIARINDNNLEITTTYGSDAVQELHIEQNQRRKITQHKANQLKGIEAINEPLQQLIEELTTLLLTKITIQIAADPSSTIPLSSLIKQPTIENTYKSLLAEDQITPYLDNFITTLKNNTSEELNNQLTYIHTIQNLHGELGKQIQKNQEMNEGMYTYLSEAQNLLARLTKTAATEAQDAIAQQEPNKPELEEITLQEAESLSLDRETLKLIGEGLINLELTHNDEVVVLKISFVINYSLANYFGSFATGNELARRAMLTNLIIIFDLCHKSLGKVLFQEPYKRILDTLGEPLGEAIKTKNLPSQLWKDSIIDYLRNKKKYNVHRLYLLDKEENPYSIS